MFVANRLGAVWLVKNPNLGQVGLSSRIMNMDYYNGQRQDYVKKEKQIFHDHLYMLMNNII